MLNPNKQINIDWSLCPWGYQKQVQRQNRGSANPVDYKQQTIKKKSIKSKTIVDRVDTSIQRTLINHKPFPIIQVQRRMPTEVFLLVQKKQEQKLINKQPLKRLFLLELPSSFKAPSAKKSIDRQFKTGPLSQRKLITPKQQPRNFHQQIEQLNKIYKIYTSRQRQGVSLTKKIRIDCQIIKKCSLQNVRVFSQQKNAKENSKAKVKKMMTQVKAHILDRILSKFEQ